MDDYFLRLGTLVRQGLDLLSRRGRNRGVRITKINILLALILVVAASLFFSVRFEAKAQTVSPVAEAVVREATVDPLNRIGKGTMKLAEAPTNITLATPQKGQDKKTDERELRYLEMIKGHPIEKMAEEISKRDEKTAAFLIAIARKESSWGEHAPSKNGRDCFNYWGYKGSYKLNMGYSCFDSREQAIEIVGDKIKSLIDKKIDTPERMLVWKCGSSCRGHDPSGVRKWVSDVSGIFYKLNS